MPSRTRHLVSVCTFVLAVAISRPSLAGPIYQPDSTLIPVGSALQQIFDGLGEPIEAIHDAQVVPEAFAPQSQSVLAILARSGPYQSAFGWYNDLGSEPELYELHGIFEGSHGVGSVVVHDFWSDPEYVGGDIGFVEGVGWNADLEDPSTILNVGSEKLLIFTQPDYTPGGEYPDRFVHVLIYASVLDPTKYYFAFEDTLLGDNDFDDLVVSSTGLAASGSGAAAVASAPGLSLRTQPSLAYASGGRVDVTLGLPVAGSATLEVLDAGGRRVRTLWRARLCGPGFLNASWDSRDEGGRPVDAGLYFVRLQVGTQSAVRQVVRF